MLKWIYQNYEKEVEDVPETPEFNTLEEARAEILRLNGELATANTERENYSNRISELTADLETVREINQQYFLQLRAQNAPTPDPEDDEQEPPSCEDFALTLTI